MLIQCVFSKFFICRYSKFAMNPMDSMEGTQQVRSALVENTADSTSSWPVHCSYFIVMLAAADTTNSAMRAEKFPEIVFIIIGRHDVRQSALII